MFSGIIEEMGEVKNISRRSGGVTLIEVKAGKALSDTRIGDSIAVNGVCLTVIAKKEGFLSFEAMQQTLNITNLGKLKVSEKVNLERSLKAGDRISGHFVNGHVDCLGIIRQKIYREGNSGFEIALPAKFMRYALEKGSISLDGISLTIAEKRASGIVVYIIPHTLKNTTLSFKGPSSELNVEFDIFAKAAIPA